ncbi:MAG: FliM/FliN family flagellar motor C-terminal domain-containing protein [Planctomycetota bacterium]|nr:FliM/FliN family flagellar motor C-terminal domain-containing protein [Planctomycetota bacterium]
MNEQLPQNAVGEVEVTVTVVLAESTRSLEEVLSLGPGATLDLGQPPETRLALEVDGVRIGSGHVVERRGRLGFRLDELTTRTREPR